MTYFFAACIFAARYCHTADYHTGNGREFIGTRTGEYGGYPCAQTVAASGRLREIKSETRDGAGVIRLEFDFGVNTDLAFIEVNEKIDAAMNSLPKEVTRPKAIKASATDIPVLYVNMTLKKRRCLSGNRRATISGVVRIGGECGENAASNS